MKAIVKAKRVHGGDAGTMFRRGRKNSRAQRGAQLLELAIALPVLLLLAVGVTDFARGYYLGVEVASAARAGAQYGAQNLGTYTDTTGMVSAAKADAADVSTWSSGFPTAAWGCMCSDGSGQSASCGTPPTCSSGTQQVNYVTVTAKATYTPLIRWPGIPNPITMNNTVTYQAGQ